MLTSRRLESYSIFLIDFKIFKNLRGTKFKLFIVIYFENYFKYCFYVD